MKKLFLLLAFTGIVAASSATTIASFTKATITNVGDDKKAGDDKKKKKCDKDKSCCKAKTCEASTKACSGEKKEGKCCKAKATGTTSTATETK